MSLEDDLLEQRVRRISEIESLGFKAYGQRFDFTHTVPQILHLYGTIPADDLADQPRVKISGRIQTVRRMGKAGFMHLLQSGERLQVYVRKDGVSERDYKLYELLDLGDIVGIDPSVVQALQNDAFIPVISPLGFGPDNESYNINADLVAAKLATVLKAEKLVLLTNTPGVLDQRGQLLTDLSARRIDELFADGTISGGMLPKISGALDAAKSGVNSVHIIDGRVPHALLLEILTDQAFGTLIRSH